MSVSVRERLCVDIQGVCMLNILLPLIEPYDIQTTHYCKMQMLIVLSEEGAGSTDIVNAPVNLFHENRNVT